MKGSEIKMEDVAERIATLIVEQNYINKADLIPKINSYLKAFVKQQSMSKLIPKDLKQENILLQKQMNFVLNEQGRYLGSELCKIVGVDAMKEHNERMVEIRKMYGC
jgi:hypothetical protein